MQSFQFTIRDPLGVHARPAGMLVREATHFQSSITLQRGDDEVNAKRAVDVLGMSIRTGDTITIVCSGDDEQAAKTALMSYMEASL